MSMSLALFCHYFAAEDDEVAASVIHYIWGPSGGTVSVALETPRRGFFRRRHRGLPAPDEAITPAVEPPEEVQFEVVETQNIDPVVQMATLEQILTGRDRDSVLGDPRCGLVLADRGSGQVLVVTLTDGLTQALAQASDARLGEVAVPWATTEEFRGYGDAPYLTEFLQALAALARHAAENQQRLYCWVTP